MKISSTLVTVATLAAVSITFAPSPTIGAPAPRTVAKGTTVTAADQAATDANTVLYKGMRLPRLPISKTGARSESIYTCNLGDTMNVGPMAHIDLEGASHKPSSYWLPPTGPLDAFLSPPNADWVVMSYSRVVTSAGPPYQLSDSLVPKNFTFLSSGQFNAAKQNTQSYIGNLNLGSSTQYGLNIQLSSIVSNMASYTASIYNSGGGAEIDGRVEGTGVFNPNTGHAWLHAYLNATLECAPQYLHDQGALQLALKTWVDDWVRTHRQYQQQLMNPH